MAGKVVSIEIGQQITKICEVDYKRKAPRVYHCVSFETPENVIEDGFICDKEALAKILKEQMDKAGIKNERVVFTVASTKIANREVVIPDVKENRIRDIVLANASDYFPIDIEEYNLSHVVLEKVVEGDSKQLRLLVLAAPGDLIKNYYELADLMGLTIMAIDYIGNSSYQSLKYQEIVGTNLVVQMNDQNTIINLIENGCLLLQRTLPYGVNLVTEAVIDHPAFEADEIFSALRLLQEQPIVGHQFKDGYPSYGAELKKPDADMLLEQAKEEVTNAFKLLITNINRVMDYFTTKHQGKKIDGIHIVGDGAYIQNIDTLISTEIGIQAVRASGMGKVSFVKDAASVIETQNSYACCIGAAIAPAGFRPRELEEKVATVNSMRFPTMMLGVCAAGAVLIFLSSVIMYRQAKYEKNELDKKIATIADIEAIYNEYEGTKQNLGVLENIDGQTMNKSEEITAFLAALEEKTPKGCVLSSMTYGEGIVTVQVTANSKILCAKYIQTLKAMEQLSEVSTSGYTQEDSKVKDGPVTFSVTCTFK